MNACERVGAESAIQCANLYSCGKHLFLQRNRIDFVEKTK